MPTETQHAVQWALQQTYVPYPDATPVPIRISNSGALVNAVRNYFNANKIQYGTFGYDNLKPYL